MMVEGEQPSRDAVELNSPEHKQLEATVLSLRLTVSALSISANFYLREPDSAPYRYSVQDQYGRGLSDLTSLLNMPLVVHTDEHARFARDAISAFELECLRIGEEALPTHAADLTRAFQAAADTYFAQVRIGHEGKPCVTYEELLASHAVIPVFEERRKSLLPTPTNRKYYAEFLYAGPEIPNRRMHPQDQTLDRRLVGELYLALLEHLHACTRDEALRRMKPGNLAGFESSLVEKLGSYRGKVCFQVIQEGSKRTIQLLLPDIPTSG